MGDASLFRVVVGRTGLVAGVGQAMPALSASITG